MRSNNRYALLFILLVIGQEFCLARHAYLQTVSDHRLEKRDAKKEETNLAVRSNRQKRGVGTIVLAVALATSAASIGSEIYFAIEKCCGVYPQACRDRDEFKEIEKRMGVTTKEIDNKALDTENLKEDIIQSNYKLQEMWTQMQLIGEYTDELVQTLGPEIVKQMNNEWKLIEDQLKAKNKTVQEMSYADIEDKYETYFNSFKNTMIGLSSFIGLTLTAVGTAAFKYHKNNQINTMIDDLGSGKEWKQLTNAKNTKAQKMVGLTGTNVKSFKTQTAVAKVNSKYGGSSFSSVLNGINVVGGLISIGFDIFAIINRFKYCKERRDQVAKAVAELRNTEVDLSEVEKNVTDYYNFLLNDGWNFITSQVANAQFQETIREFQSLADGSDSITPSLSTASSTIDNFLGNINNSISDTKQTYNLIDQLNTALKGINVRMKCYVNRGRMLKHVSDECKRGADSLKNLYNNSVSTFGVHGGNCIVDSNGNLYTTFEGIEKSIASLAADENYNPDCILNSDAKKDEACRYEQDGYTETKIASKMSLTTQQVQHFLSNCPEPELTPRDIKLICRFAALGDSAADIKDFLMLSQKESTIQNVMNNDCN